MSTQAPPQGEKRQVFVSRSAFIFAAVGSAVGLGNIWRFPYVAYESGGGAFILPYLIALLTAGIPLLFLDYAIGHRFRSSAPLAFRSMNRAAEPIGWIQVGIATVIAIYYSAIIAWAASYAWFSLSKAWGDDPEGFLFGSYLQLDDGGLPTADIVPAVLGPLIGVWVITLVILFLGVQGGIARFSKVFIPLLIVLFVGLVIRALTLDGAMTGLDALFKPDFSQIAKPSVWIAAYGQIFFSLSVAFGIMLTYASYLKKRTNLTGSGLVVGLSNSAFEILAGLGVFAALGFMATAAGTEVSEVAAGGVGLAFVVFPLIISEMPFGEIFGVLFFVSLIFAGLSSLISLVQVPIAAVSDKLGISQRKSTGFVGGGMALLAVVGFSTTSGLITLDTIDYFVNNIGIVGIAIIAVITVAWVLRRLPFLRDHLNAVSTFKLGKVWMAFVGVITPIVLVVMLVQVIITTIKEGYEGYPQITLNLLGWGVLGLILVVSILLSITPWPRKSLEKVERAQAEFEQQLSSPAAAPHATTEPQAAPEATPHNENGVTP
ncbi:sodium-dependent transporter [Brevibacterium ravenspurgense]|uniref:Transporter n=1 Tax=Brevibacterium ravenspurgense TaxID=479117 RepID=A0A2I1IGZ8_9MICO|nr:sodium-dependent transporter [Brevibacterium ravenspurgense]PKY70410.1 sodium-dependent transporter [Brevibacterium ravenspurgense]